MEAVRRLSSQPLIPARHTVPPADKYDLYPAHPLGAGQIEVGYRALASYLAGAGTAILDGYAGVFWPHLRERLDDALLAQGVCAHWVNVDDALRSPGEIRNLVDPFLGGDDPLFGTRFTGTLLDFFDPEQLASLAPDETAALNIIYGCGAALAGWHGLLVYVDLPKNELQYRSRAGTICNLGAARPDAPQMMYKRFYFVDWVTLNQHKAAILPDIDLFVDEQRPDEPALAAATVVRSALVEMSHTFFRVRPWFEPGPWGGDWLKRHIPQLPQDVPNYAWSFELIVPENGLLFHSDGRLLELSFDFLMFAAHGAVLGEFAPQFGTEFPIRFDYLDTINGGNLSLQCHPRSEFIRHHFGESYTQDEAYYIVACQPGAKVYLGFREDVEPLTFRAALERSERQGTPVDVERFVNTRPAQAHDLFLIPSGTVHCAGTGNLVLEISATPYIFTFKMYDWLRLDLNGRRRPLNIARAFQNLKFDRKGDRVRRDLLVTPSLVAEGAGWQVVHLPTHAEHFYDVHRLEFDTGVAVATDGSPHVLNLVEGSSLVLEVGERQQRFNFGETFVVPAAAEQYRLTNEGSDRAKVVKAFLDPDYPYR